MPRSCPDHPKYPQSIPRSTRNRPKADLWNPRSFHSRFPGRFTRDSQVVSLVIPRFPAHVFVKKFGKNVKIGFLDSWDQNKILKFSWFFYMTGISYINHYFLAPRPPKPLKSRPQGQNLPGFLLRAHSAHREPLSAWFCHLSCHLLTSVSFISLSWVL